MILRSKLTLIFFLAFFLLSACEGYQEVKTPDTLNKRAHIILPGEINLSQVKVRNPDGSFFTPDSDFFDIKVRKEGLSLIGALLPSGSWFLTIATPSDEVVCLSPTETAKTLLFLFPGVFVSDPDSARRMLNSMQDVHMLSDFISSVSPVDNYITREEFASYYMSAFMSLPEEVFPSAKQIEGNLTSSEPAILSLPLYGVSFEEESFDLGFPYHFKVNVSLVGDSYLISLQPTGDSLCFCGVFEINAIPQEVLSGGVKDSCVDFSVGSTLGFFSSIRSFEIPGMNDRFVIDSNSPALYLFRLSSGSFDLPFGDGASPQFDELVFLGARPSLSEIHFKGFEFNVVHQVISFLSAFGVETDGVVNMLFDKEQDIKAAYEALMNAALVSPQDPCLNPFYSLLVNLLCCSLPEDDGIFSYLKEFFSAPGREIASRISRYPACGILREVLFGGSLFTPIDTLIISIGEGEAEEAFRSISSLLADLKEYYNSGNKEKFIGCLTDDFLFDGMNGEDFFDYLDWREIKSVELLKDNFVLSGGAEAKGDVLIEYESPTGYLHKGIYRMSFSKRDGRWLLRGNGKIAEVCLRFWEAVLSDSDRPAYLVEAQVKEAEKFPLKSVKLVLPSGAEIELSKEEGGDTWVVPVDLAYEKLVNVGNMVYLGSSVEGELRFALLLTSREGVENEVNLVADPLSSEELMLMRSSLDVRNNMLSWDEINLPREFYPWEAIYVSTGKKIELNFCDDSLCFEGSASPALLLRDVYGEKAILLDPEL